MFSFLNSIKTNNVINIIRMKKMKMGEYIYHTINDDYNNYGYNDYKIKSYVDNSTVSLSDVKSFIKKLIMYQI